MRKLTDEDLERIARTQHAAGSFILGAAGAVMLVIAVACLVIWTGNSGNRASCSNGFVGAVDQQQCAHVAAVSTGSAVGGIVALALGVLFFVWARKRG